MVLVSPPKDREEIETAHDETFENASAADTVEDLLGTDNEAGPDTIEQQEASTKPPILPTDEWTSDQSVVWRIWLQRTIAIVVGVLLAIGLFGFLAIQFSRSDAPDTVAEEGEAEVAAVAADTPADTSAAEVTPPPQNPELGPEDPLLDEPPPVEPPPVPALEPDTIAVETPPPAEDTGDALGAPPGLLSPDPTPRRTVAMPGGPTVAEMLREVDALLAEPPESLPPTASPPPTDPPVEEVAADPTPTRPPPLSVDVEERLKDRIPEMQCVDTPLINFVRFLGEFSTIPISLHAASLNWLSLSAETPINLNEKDRSIEELMDLALTPLGLEQVVTDDHLILRRKSRNAAGELREVSFKLHDLVGDDTEKLGRLSATIVQVIDPASWSAQGGDGTIREEGTTLVVRQSEPVQFEILFFCEKLRIARGLPVRGEFSVELFDPVQRATRERALQEKLLTLTFLRPVALAELCERIEQAVGVRILINWHALSAEGWNPHTTVDFRALNEPWWTAFLGLLETMNLTLRTVNEEVIEVTTQQAEEQTMQVECYQVDAEPDLIELQNALGSDHFRSSGGPCLLQWNPDFEVVVVVAPQHLQRQAADWFGKE